MHFKQQFHKSLCKEPLCTFFNYAMNESLPLRVNVACMRFSQSGGWNLMLSAVLIKSYLHIEKWDDNWYPIDNSSAVFRCTQEIYTDKSSLMITIMIEMTKKKVYHTFFYGHRIVTKLQQNFIGLKNMFC